MDKESDSPELQTGPPATDAAQNDQSISAEEAQKELLKLDSKLIDPPILEKNDRPNEEIPATEGDLEASDGPVVEASNHPELGARSNQPGSLTDSSTSDEDEVDSSDDDTTSASMTQDLEGKKGRRRVKYIPRPIKKKLRKRIEKAPKLLAQQAQYAKLVEDRLADVEKRLKEMESQRPTMFKDKGKDREKDEGISESDSADSRATTPEPKDKYPEILGINRVTFEQYKPNKSSYPRPSRYDLEDQHERGQISLPELPQRYLIDVVVPHTSASESFQISYGVKPSGVSTAAPKDAAAEGLAVKNTQNVVPDRIRINSSLLFHELADITGQNLNQLSLWKSIVILKPFKILVMYEQEIRNHVIDLKGKVALLDANGPAGLSTAKLSGELSGEVITTEVEAHPEGASGLKNPSLEDLAMQGAETDTVTAKDKLERSKRLLQELQLLVEVLDYDLKSVFDFRRCIQEGDIRSIAFCDLWHLFPIGGDIRLNDRHSQVYRIAFTSGGRPALCSWREARTSEPEPEPGVEANDPMAFNMSCFYLGFNGKHLGIVQRDFEIKRYDNKKAVTSLPVYPVQFSGTEDGDPNRKDFVRRGKKFVELTKDRSSVVHKRYRGLTLDLEELREEVDAEVIIDTSMALLKNPSLETKFGMTQILTPDPRQTLEFLDPDGCKEEGCHQNTGIHQDHQVDEKCSTSLRETTNSYRDLLESPDIMQPEDFLICPCMVYGYVLRSRKWVCLDVDVVEDIAVQELGFESLVLPKGHSETLLALVETHSKGTKPATGRKVVERQIDLVRGKGKGLIILLHGEPGVGKTSTAECVAEYTKRPLFQVTCGDIGSSAEEVERTLENHFQLAHKWGCVLLLDEADVFLMARTKQDLKRNAIVSVFLRVLEYYSGVLFLTTNRVGTFDPAFRSRIHMSLFYPKLDLKTTLKIWTMNLDRTRKMWAESIEIDPDERDKILAFAEEHFKDSEKLKTTWNGRQIRNAFQTAIALAEYEIHKARKRFKMKEDPVPRLEAWQFEKVAEASKHFDEYLKATVGLEEDRARRNFERRDDLGVDF